VAGDLPTRGYLLLGEVNHAALRIHFLTPVGALLVSGGSVDGPKWLAYFFLVLLHEFGHAIAVWRGGLRVLAIDVLPIGGLCRYAGIATPLQESVIAFAGVWAQLLAFAVAWPLHRYFGPAMSSQVRDFVWVFTTPNLIIAAINLIPIPPLDGADAWALFPRLYRRVFRKGRREKLRTKVDALDAVLNKPEGGKAERPAGKDWLN
jgi:stage IV sporulation protein FB